MKNLWAILVWFVLCLQLSAAQLDHATRIASLIDPAKLATLRERGANPRACAHCVAKEELTFDCIIPG